MIRRTPSSQYASPNDPSLAQGSGQLQGGANGGGNGGSSPSRAGPSEWTGENTVRKSSTEPSKEIFMRPFSIMALCLALGCGPGTPTHPPAITIYDLRLEQLASLYRRNPKDKTFLRQTIRCHLDAKSYRVGSNRIECHIVNESGCVWFLGNPPPDNTRPIIATGVVSGTIRDGILREPGVDYYVAVENASFTVP